MKSKLIEIEKVKSVVIVVLFVMTILLLSFFWKDVKMADVLLPIDRIMDRTDDITKPQPESMVRPYEIRISFGTEVYTKLAPEYKLSLEESIPEKESQQAEDEAIATNEQKEKNQLKEIHEIFFDSLRAYFNQGNTIINEITQEQYGQVMKYKSITAEYNYNIPFREFVLINISEQSFDGQQIEYINSIGYSSASQESIFIYDGMNNKYYHIAVDKRENAIQEASEKLDKMIIVIEGEGSTSYYKASTFFGGANEVLLPYANQSEMTKVDFKAAFSTDDEKAVEEAANEFFGSSLDFVRKITENKGSLLYMYGYGEKVLLIDSSGKIEYTQEPDFYSYSREGFYSSLTLALEFVTSHGGWQNIINGKKKPVLVEAIEIKDNKGNYSGYRFVIGIKYKNDLIYYANSPYNLITVEILGNQIIKYVRNSIIIGEKETVYTDSEIDAESPINIITANYEFINNVIHFDPASADIRLESEKIYDFDRMVSEIELMSPGYLRPEVSNIKGDTSYYANMKNYLTPIWVMKIRDYIFYFDIINGSILSYDKGGEADGLGKN